MIKHLLNLLVPSISFLRLHALDNLSLDGFDDIMDADLEDLDDLPPIGVPPTGHYNFEVTLHTEMDGDKQRIYAEYKILDVNELADPEADAGDVAVGQTFRQYFTFVTKEGKKNEFGIGAFKQLLRPIAGHFGLSKTRDVCEKVVALQMAASVKRVPNKKDPENPRMRMKDLIVI